MMADLVERRRTPRAWLRGDATIQLPDNARVQARLLDVGVGGMALIGRHGAPPGYVRIRFKLGPQSGIVDVGGRVVRERSDGEQTVWGVQFHALDLGTRIRLRDYVNRQQRVGAAS
jgi:c-di-GMP-binding flagellar brake protein YcgR